MKNFLKKIRNGSSWPWVIAFGIGLALLTFWSWLDTGKMRWDFFGLFVFLILAIAVGNAIKKASGR